MAETITMPKLGFDMQEGTLVRWVRNEGENINKGDVLAEIETDKATVEVESSASGVVRRLLVDQGAVVPIGAAITIVRWRKMKHKRAGSGGRNGARPARLRIQAARPCRQTGSKSTRRPRCLPSRQAPGVQQLKPVGLAAPPKRDCQGLTACQENGT